jgi:hypothetical protein
MIDAEYQLMKPDTSTVGGLKRVCIVLRYGTKEVGWVPRSWELGSRQYCNFLEFRLFRREVYSVYNQEMFTLLGICQTHILERCKSLTKIINIIFYSICFLQPETLWGARLY